MTWGHASWWSWLVTVTALAAGRLGWVPGLAIAIGVTSVHALVLGLARGRHFAMQVRVVYVVALVVGLGLPAVHWLEIAGTLLLLVFDYCIVSPILALMPWNRRLPLTFALVRAVMMSPPIKGSVLALVQVPRA